jgi:uncharacterized coiled-coil protein SlyX
MNSPEQSSSADALAQLRRETEALREELSEALTRATYLGMTAEEATTYDTARERLTALLERLRELQSSREVRATA